MLDQSKKDSCIPCGLHTPARNTYFDGKLLTSRDFQAEQDYGRGHRQLHNAMLHGTGVVCGLELIQHPAMDCRRKFIVLQPGMALDCCGQEIIVPEPVLVRIADTVADDAELAEDLTGDKHLFVAIRRCDAGAEPLPVLLPGCDGEGGATEYGRILEGYEMVLFARDPLTVTAPDLPTDPNFAWVHSIAMEGKTPTAIALNAVENQTLIGSQATDGTSRINIYDAETLDLVAQLNGPKVLGDIVVSNSLGMIFASGIAFGDGRSGIGAWSLIDIATKPDPAFVIALSDRVPARLALSPTSGTLFVLDQTANTQAELLSFSSEAIAQDQDNVAAGQKLTFNRTRFGADGSAFMRRAAMMAFSPDGRFLAIAAPDLKSGNGLFVIEVAQFIAGNIDRPATARPETDALGPDERAHVVGWSLDSAILYLGTQDDSDARIHRFAMTGDANKVEASGSGIKYAGSVLDLAIAPTETQAYLLLADPDGITRFVATPIETIKAKGSSEPSLATLPDNSIRIDGDGLHMALTTYGNRLLVSAADAAPADQPDRGLVAVIDITEAQCDAIFATATDGCATCDDRTIDTPDHAVILGHLPGYIAGAEQVMADAGNASDEHVAIDNAAFRTIVPSATKLREVIECMLSRGVAEGPPGPRGEPGLQGPAGANGSNGTNGINGEDGEDGADGEDGEDGKDGKDGTAIDVNAIGGISWEHGSTLNNTAASRFISQLTEIGLAFEFQTPVRFNQFNGTNLPGETMLVEVQRRILGDNGYVWTVIPEMVVHPIAFDTPDSGTLITDWNVIDSADEVKGVVIRYEPKTDNIIKAARGEMIRVVFFTDFVIDSDGRVLDGTHLAGKLPTGQGTPGSTFRSWFRLGNANANPGGRNRNDR